MRQNIGFLAFGAWLTSLKMNFFIENDKISLFFVAK
jgi:hypothetical protein